MIAPGATPDASLSEQTRALSRALDRVIDPEIRKPITELDMIGATSIIATTPGEAVATVDLKLTIVGCPAAQTIERDVREAAASVAGALESWMRTCSDFRSPGFSASPAPSPPRSTT
jgi:ATP-binding protein involved in chromosome partitioning